MRPSRLVLLALAVGVVALVPRLVWQNAGLFHADSVATARSVESLVLDGRWLPAAGPVHVLVCAPLFWLHHTIGGAAGADAAVTLQSGVAGAVAAGLAVVLARPFVRTDAGAVAAGLIVAALPTLLSVTTFAGADGTQVALVLAAAVAAERRRGVVTGVLLGLAIGTRVESVVVAPALLLLLWRGDLPVGLDATRGVHLRVPAADLMRRLAAVAGPALLLGATLHLVPASPRPDVWLGAPESGTWLGPASVVLPDSLRVAARTLTPLGALLAAAGLVALWRADRSRVAVVVMWAVVAFTYAGNRSDAEPRDLVVALVILALPIAAALDAARGGLRVASAIALAGLLAWMIVPLAPTLAARSRSCAPDDLARRIARETETGAVIVAMDLAGHIDHIAQRRTLGHAPLDGTDADTERIDASLAAIIETVTSGVPVYVTSDAFAYDAPHGDVGFLDAEIGGWDGHPTGGREALGRWGTALIGAVELRIVTRAPWDDWHGTSLGRRRGSARTLALYRALPATE